jgi:L-ascorbate metabolism protein UlaG (beta-lactamase superfamily)
MSAACQNRGMELTWYGRTCIRLRGRDAVVVADPYIGVVGPTGRGITAEIVIFSHPDEAPVPKARAKAKRSRDGKTVLPTSLEDAFVLDAPGEYEVKDVLLTGVRTFRDDRQGADRGKQTAFVVELDGMHTIHLGEIGHLLTEDELAEVGSVDIACIPVGGRLSATHAAELVAQLDPRIVVPMPVCADDADCREALAKFFHEMGGEPVASPKLAVTLSGLPAETTTVLLESRGKVAAAGAPAEPTPA